MILFAIGDRDIIPVIGDSNATVVATIAVIVVVGVTVMRIMVPKIDVEAIIGMSRPPPGEG